jgi:FKBP-type peptidyl-prolyl cis-trans isomerase
MRLRIYPGFIIVVTVTAFMVQSCVNNDLEELENKERQIIEQYLTENNIPAEAKTAGGIYFIDKKTGTGLAPKKGDYIVINYAGRYLEDGTIRETNFDSLKSEWPISSELENYLFGPSKIVFGYSMPGINEALALMKEGGKASAIIPSDKANYDYRPLVYDLELIKVIREVVRYEDSVLNVFSSKYYSNEGRIDTLGIWTRIDSASPTLNIFGTGDSLFFNFTGKLVDGFGDSITVSRIFDSNAGLLPVRYLYRQSRLSKAQTSTITLPAGLKTAIDSMQISNGMKFSVLLKYNYAFNKTGLLSKDKYIIIPEYQNVVYDIEVTSIRPE